jgi:hypothetical protein
MFWAAAYKGNNTNGKKFGAFLILWRGRGNKGNEGAMRAKNNKSLPYMYRVETRTTVAKTQHRLEN